MTDKPTATQDNDKLRSLTQAVLDQPRGIPTPDALDALMRFSDATSPTRVLALLDEVAAAQLERDIIQHLAEQVITAWRDERIACREWGDDGPSYRRARGQFEDAMCALSWHLNPASRLLVVPPEQQAMPLDPPSSPGRVQEPSDDPC